MEDSWLDVTSIGDQWVKALNTMSEQINAMVQSLAFTKNDIGELVKALEPPEPEEFWTPEPVIGWRAWTLAGNPATILAGANGTMWRKRYLVAAHAGSTSHQSPSWSCLCGINAAKRVEDLGSYNTGIWGQVALTGVVHEYERGYRAEKGEMLNLTMRAKGRQARKLADTLSDHYKIPVVLV